MIEKDSTNIPRYLRFFSLCAVCCVVKENLQFQVLKIENLLDSSIEITLAWNFLRCVIPDHFSFAGWMVMDKITDDCNKR